MQEDRGKGIIVDHGCNGVLLAMLTQTLDVKGLNCPLPILKAKQALNKLSSGDRLTVLATDPGSLRDFQAYCRVTGNVLHESNEHDGVFNYVIEKS